MYTNLHIHSIFFKKVAGGNLRTLSTIYDFFPIFPTSMGPYRTGLYLEIKYWKQNLLNVIRVRFINWLIIANGIVTFFLLLNINITYNKNNN